jgi:hypothetical protein
MDQELPAAKRHKALEAAVQVLDYPLFFGALVLWAVSESVEGRVWNWLGWVGMAWFIGRILVTVVWGIWWSHRTGTPLRWGYGGWYVPRRRWYRRYRGRRH